MNLSWEMTGQAYDLEFTKLVESYELVISDDG